jgi:crotonobetaine/carnitine-CoA ligase
MSFRLAVADRTRWTLPAVLRERVEAQADAPYVTFALGERSFTYGAWDAETDAVAGGLARLGLEKGEAVLQMLRNRAELPLVRFGANKLGAVEVPVNVDYRGYLLEHVFNTVRARILVCEADFVEEVAASRDRLEHLRTVVVVGDELPAVQGLDIVPFGELLAAGRPPAVDVQPRDVATIQFTSGTSGPSKGAQIPHAHSHLLAELNGELLGVDRESVIFTELPLFHVNAQMSMLTTLLHGGRIAIEPRFSASEWLGRLRRHGASHTPLLGVMLAFLLKLPERPDDADNPLRVVWAVPRVAEVMEPFMARFGVEQMLTSYGCTEIGMPVQGHWGTPAHVTGRVVDEFFELRIVDPETGDPVSPGEVGEVVTRNRLPWCVTRGYLGMPERTEEAYRDCWFHTGDAARIDEDGWFTFMDRIKDRIRRRGENVASADVEHVLGEHEGIAESAVIAVKSDEPGGEDEIKACIVRASGVALAADDVWAWCDERLPHFAVPRYVEFLDALPKTPTEKVRKNVLREGGVTPGTHDRGPAARGRGRR